MRLVWLITLVCVFSLPKCETLGQTPLLQPNDRVALLGGTFVERMQVSGSLEAAIQRRWPTWQLRFRNVGWSGDDVHGTARKGFDEAAKGFDRLMRDIDVADPTVVLVAYGFSEASDGTEAVNRFEPGLRRLVTVLADGGRRVVLLTPVAMPGYRVDGYRDFIRACGNTIRNVGDELNVPVVSIEWQPKESEVIENGLLPNQKGFEILARELAGKLVDGGRCPDEQSDLRKRIIEKNRLFFHRYRPQNETYLFLFRKHEQGNHAVEIQAFDPLIDAADQAIWQAAASG